MGNITPAEIQTAAMLVQLGVTTIEKIATLFKSSVNDDAELAAIMTEVNTRIARRS